MTRTRLSEPSRADLATILSTSEERWGREGRKRYAKLLARAIRIIGTSPDGPVTRGHPELGAGIRSLHVRHARGRVDRVDRPVHVVYSRRVADVVEIARVLHDRMEPRATMMR